ncbi:TIGR03619 family F420-dependent LLM class oxidoreductase [Gordonia neofelifaecis]|nr:TIGR03619 family F420-dependent LLM class oxidoreductase [Gordonia neofelifaecis]
MTTLSLIVPNFGDTLAADDFGALIDMCVAAEEAGFDRVILTEHVVMGSQTGDYGWGTFPTGPDAPWLDPLTALAMVAARTTTLRLGTGIVIGALRGGANLAKTAATLHLLSGGRVDLGVGTGWQAREYEAVGLSFADRGRLLDDTLAVCRALWSEAPAAVDRPGIQFSDVYCNPRPTADAPLPIWVSGTLTGPVRRRLVQWGDGWIPIMTATDDDIAAGVELLKSDFAAAGRDPETLQVRGRLIVGRTEDKQLDLELCAKRFAAQRDLGATDVAVALQGIDRDPATARTKLAEFASAMKAGV